MKKTLSILLVACILSGCSLFRTHKMDVEQGNVVSAQDVGQLHTGMTSEQVKDIMGEPVLTNLFTNNQMVYVYTFQSGYGKQQITRVTCTFQHNRLRDISKS
jgi:outer membrane protein assembly factor BamE